MLPRTRRLSHLFLAGDEATIEAISNQIARSGGCMASAARALGVTRVTLYNWTRMEPRLQQAVDAARKAQR